MRDGAALTIDDEIRRAARLLESLIQTAGVLPEELERRLDASPGYLGRVLSGEMELKLRHILAILRALEIEPGLFFEVLYPAADPAAGSIRIEDVRERLLRLGFGQKRSVEPPQLGIQELEKLVQGAVQAALSRREPRDGKV